MTASARNTFMGCSPHFPAIYHRARCVAKRACLNVKDDPTCRISTANRPRPDRIWCNHPVEEPLRLRSKQVPIACTSSTTPTRRIIRRQACYFQAALRVSRMRAITISGGEPAFMQSEPPAVKFDIAQARRVLGDVFAPWIQDLGLSIERIECTPPA